MNNFSKVIGDSWTIPVQLKEAGVNFPVDQATEIKAVFYDQFSNNITEVITLSSTEAGADWASGLVVIKVPSLETSKASPGPLFIEIQAEINAEKSTWCDIEMQAKRGQIP